MKYDRELEYGGTTLIGDIDREKVVAQIHEFFTKGYLTQEEMDTRVSEALASRTHPQLERAMRQLPLLSKAPVKKEINWMEDVIKPAGFVGGILMIPAGIALAVTVPTFVCVSDTHGIPAMNAVYIALSLIFGIAAFVIGCCVANEF